MDTLVMRSKLNTTQQTAKFFETLMHISTDGIAITDAAQNIILVNDPFCVLFGKHRQDVIETGLYSWLEQMGSDAVRCWTELERRVQLEGKCCDIQFQMATDEGMRHLNVSASLLEPVAGEKQGGIVSIWRDITEQVLTTRSLQDSEGRLRLLTESAEGIITVQDLDGKYLYCNGVSRYGLDAADVFGKTPFDFHSSEAAARIVNRLRQVVARNQSMTTEHYMVLEGKTIWFAHHIYPVNDENGNCTAVATISLNIAERKRMEVLLRESEIAHKTLVHNIPGMVYRAGMDWSAQMISNGEELCGYNSDELNARENGWLSILHPDDREWVYREGANLVESPASVVQTYRIIAKNGTVRWVEDHKTSLFSVDGEFKGIDGIVLDVTERKQTEEEVHTLNEDLERRVIKRTAQLSSSNQELEAFAYSVSHDLRAPLRAISGFSQIIAHSHKNSLNEAGQHYFDNIVKASVHMNQLIDDLLLYSRVGRQAVSRQPVPLSTSLAQAMRNLADRIAETGAIIDIPDELPTVKGNQTLLSQVFTNLLDNALIYHRPDVAPEVMMNCRIKADRVIISVADKGIGILPEFHEKIFNIFQRLHSHEEYPGTGIGLAIVRKAVDLLDGRVWMESEIGVGSTFYVELPLM